METNRTKEERWIVLINIKINVFIKNCVTICGTFIKQELFIELYLKFRGKDLNDIIRVFHLLFR